MTRSKPGLVRRVLVALVLIVASVIGGVLAVGYSLPVAHVATRDVVVGAPPERVFATVRDVARHPTWRPDVDRVEIVAETPAFQWREYSGGDAILFEIIEEWPNERLVTKIADPSLPFGGTWSYTFAPEGNGTRVTIREDGEVHNPVFRFMSRFVFGHTATIDAFLTHLSAQVSK